MTEERNKTAINNNLLHLEAQRSRADITVGMAQLVDIGNGAFSCILPTKQNMH